MVLKVIFYEKPGCVTNAKQKKVLRQSGIDVECRDLLTEKWTKKRLSSFFRGYLVSEWFNPAAPAIKKGEIKLDNISAADAIKIMLDTPLLIRRPLIEVGEQTILGFRISDIESATSKKLVGIEQELNDCSR